MKKFLVGGAQIRVGRACAPLCPTLATPLDVARASHQLLEISIFGQSYHANAKTYNCHSWTTGRVTVQLVCTKNHLEKVMYASCAEVNPAPSELSKHQINKSKDGLYVVNVKTKAYESSIPCMK